MCMSCKTQNARLKLIMKICFVLNQLYKPGGIERTISHRMIELSKHHEIFVITMENGDNEFYFGKSDKVKYIDLDSKFQRKANGSFKKNIANIIRSSLSYAKLQSTILKIKPDITVNVVGTHSLMFIPFMVGIGKTVLEHHSSFSQIPTNEYKRKLMQRYDYNIFLSKEEAELGSFLRKGVVIPNFVAKNSELSDYSNRENRIIAAGRVVEVKGFERLIKAWHLICHNHPTWHLDIYGETEGNTLKDLKALITKLKISDKVSFCPATPNITKIMLNSKIYAMSSHYECYPMVLLEAMSAGMLIIAFDCPTGPRNIINDETGVLIKDNDIRFFSERLEHAINNEQQSAIMATKAHSQSLEYSIESIISKWNDFFSTIGA